MHKSWMWKQRSYHEQFQGDEGKGGAGGSAQAQQHDAQADDDDQQSEDETSDDEQQSDDAGAAASAPEDDGEVVITIGDEAPPAANDDEIEGKPAPAWVKELRKEARESKRRIRELEAEKAQRETAAAPKAEDVGPEPQLEEFDFDGAKYRDALLSWNDRKQKADARVAAARQEQEAAAAAWQKKLGAYRAAGAALKVEDFDGAEHVIRETMNSTQQGIIVSGADKPELVVYALGRSPALAKELAAINDPIKFAFRVAKLEAQLKVQQRKAPPAPERQVRGGAGGATAIDNTEARLEAEADRTGNRTALIRYQKEKAAKAKAAA